jgi:hypothetical protein
MIAAALALLVACGSGCSTLDRAYQQEVTWTNVPTVHVFTNKVVGTSTVPQVVERTNVVFVTNAASGAVSACAERVPLATNFVQMTLTNVVPVFETNLVKVPVTKLVAKPEAEATITAAGAVVNTFAPGIASILALALGGLYHGLLSAGRLTRPELFAGRAGRRQSPVQATTQACCQDLTNEGNGRRQTITL